MLCLLGGGPCQEDDPAVGAVERSEQPGQVDCPPQRWYTPLADLDPVRNAVPISFKSTVLASLAAYGSGSLGAVIVEGARRRQHAVRPS